MGRVLIITLIIILSALQFASAQRMSQASQVVTFSVRTTHHSPALNDAAVPADVKVTATLDMPTNGGTTREMDLRSLTEQTAVPTVRNQRAAEQVSSSLSAERTALLASRATLLTVTQ